MPHYGEFSMLDYSGESSNVSFYFGAITAVSLPGFLTQFGALRNALDNITIGTIKSEKWVGDETVLDNIPPSNSAAQVELAFLVIYEATEGGKRYRVHAPTANPSKVIPGTDIVDMADAEVQAFVTAFEAIVVPKDDDEGFVTVLKMLLVGRDR